MEDSPALTDPLGTLSGETTLFEFLNVLLSLALNNEGMEINGHSVRGGCVVHYKFEVTRVEYATVTNPETVH